MWSREELCILAFSLFSDENLLLSCGKIKDRIVQLLFLNILLNFIVITIVTIKGKT